MGILESILGFIVIIIVVVALYLLFSDTDIDDIINVYMYRKIDLEQIKGQNEVNRLAQESVNRRLIQDFLKE
jgi:hypothetical protein